MLQPAMTLSSVYGGNLVYFPGSSPHATHWLPNEKMTRDLRTGGITAIGEMPVVCAASVSTPESLGLLRDAGFKLPAEIFRYCDTADYLALVGKLCASGRKLAVHYVHPANEIPSVNFWIPPSVLSFLNNKANLAKLVLPAHLPEREIISVDQLDNPDLSRRLPLVIKAVTDESTGGGVDVRICRTPDDLRQAAFYFGICRTVVAEKFLSIERNLCLHFAVSKDGHVGYLGVAEQVSDEQGGYQGNWLDAESKCPEAALEAGLAAARRGAGYGYWGVLGVDIAMLADGSCKIFDLNFRINGSTVPVLYMEAIRNRFNKPVAKRCGFKARGSYRDMLDAVYQAMARSMLLPLASCDPDAGPYPNQPPRLTALVLGSTRAEVLNNVRRLSEMGLYL